MQALYTPFRPVFPRWNVGRVVQLLLLATTMLTQGILSMNIANSLFLTHVGSDQP
ncbi:MAG: hypothetical protein RLZZ435_2582 [Cyanobacteriota bacterium]|jgi:hypothetical protein